MSAESASDLHKIIEEVAEMIGWDGLQNRLGVSRQTIWNWKTRFREPSASVVIRCLKIKQEFEAEKQKKQ